MIQITRNQAREIRAVFKRLLCGHGRKTDPAVQFEAGPQGVFIRGMSFQGAAEYQVPGEHPAASFAVPLSTLATCEGKNDAPIQFDVKSKTTVAVSWEEGRIPQQQTVTQTKFDGGFPVAPATFAANSSDLLTALHNASQNADDENTRYALTHLQLDGAKGRIAATDGHHALFQTGFQFPWQNGVLIPASGVFVSPEFSRSEPVSIGCSANWLSLATGPWLIHLPIDKDGKYPQCDQIIPKPERIASRLQIAEGDARFLQDAIPRLPCDDLQHRPITIDLNGEVIVRATASDQPKPTELVLSNSRLVGEPVRISVNREFLARAMKLGCREIGVINAESIMTCGDERREYLIMPLSPDKSKPATDTVRIESGTASSAPPAQRLRVSPTTSNTPNTMPKPNNQERQADAEQGTNGAAEHETSTTGPISAAIELRTSLRASLASVNTLIASLRRNKRQQKLVQNTLQSLKDLQKIAG